ncbi:hypothetical protein [Microbacterium hydrocarbonoxydans]|uniref:hypothetical protein n=1 Tax=Microbacterium hydrocarbonoxydans TaxID=273678 RepID=UPI00203CF5B1|nr:hypothetical protein [Microbacterium hydrocarbonoxydans]MCM3780920.1 hypothetical protein [Microbacterium hydrocarbonoxydans]
MSNVVGAQASREEEIAFLAMEEVLGIQIQLADAGAGNKVPDGAWIYPGGEGRQGIVEITSPPATSLMSEWATAKRNGTPQSESGSVPTRFGELAEVCTEMLAEDWAQENLDKLLARAADERHLFLFGRGHDILHYFYRLSDSCGDAPSEPVQDLVLPEGISDVWFRGRSTRDAQDRQGSSTVQLARFQSGIGWHRYVASMEERQLPSPNRGIADDPVPEGWRQPKNRSLPLSDE